jgi:threonyl-tRNA synthetase
MNVSSYSLWRRPILSLSKRFQPLFSQSFSTVNNGKATAVKPLNLDLELPTNEKNGNLLKIRHSTAHVMAMAVQKLFPEVKVTIGPWIENGFYYDFHAPADKQLTQPDLNKIKKEMDRIIRANHPITREEVSVEEAK